MKNKIVTQAAIPTRADKTLASLFGTIADRLMSPL